MAETKISGTDSKTLWPAIEFIWQEAMLLDRKQYAQWLELWEPSGLYIVPIDADAVEFEDKLNYVYDDHRMRQLRVDRMMAGTAGSVIDAASTVRTLSRFVRLPSKDEGVIEVSAAQILIAYKRATTTIFAANVTYAIRMDKPEPRIERKIVRLINSEDALSSIGFFL